MPSEMGIGHNNQESRNSWLWTAMFLEPAAHIYYRTVTHLAPKLEVVGGSTSPYAYFVHQNAQPNDT
eukprot:815386-Amphidinium_carterae.2